MKRLIGCLFFIIIVISASSQIIHFETGKTISSFNYKNSDGEKLENLEGSNQNSLGLGLRMPILQTNLHISGDASYNRYGAMGSDPLLGNYYEWDATYLGLYLGFDYEFFRPPINYNEQHGFSFSPRIAVGTEFLLNGTQNLNDQINDLKNVEEFDKPLYFIRGGVQVNYYLSKVFILFGQYTYGKSFLIGDYKNQEQLRLTTHNVSIGLSINLFFRK